MILPTCKFEITSTLCLSAFDVIVKLEIAGTICHDLSKTVLDQLINQLQLVFFFFVIFFLNCVLHMLQII